MEKKGNRGIAVAGGGISGLTAAWLLHRAGFRVTLYESRSDAGGAIGTDSEQGWLAEKGPNSILLTNRYIREMITGLNLEDRVVEALPQAKNRFIVKTGKPVALPGSLLSFIRTPLFSTGAKMMLLKEPFIPASGPDTEESLAVFVKRRLGQEILDYAINPFVSGVYAGDPEKLSAKHAFPKLYELEQKYGSLVRGQLFGAGERKKSDETGRDRARMISFRGGLAELIHALKQQLGDTIRYSSTVAGVDCVGLRAGHDADTGAEKVFSGPGHKNPGSGYGRFVPAGQDRPGTGQDRTGPERVGSGADRDDTGFFLTVNGETAGPYSHVICAGNAHDLASWDFREGIRGTPGKLDDIHYPPVTSVTLGFRKKDIRHPLDGFGMLVPEAEPFRILGTLFTSSIFEGRAPSTEFATLTTYVGGTRYPEFAGLPDDELLKLVTGDLARLLGLDGKPLFVRIYRWPKAIPQYNTGYGVFKDSMSRFESDNPGIYLLGNYRNGISVPDCIKAAYELAGTIS